MYVPLTTKQWAEALGRAIAWSSKKHEGQFDRSGRPYILHTLTVMQVVIHLGDDYAILGVCHDTVEDCFGHDYEAGFTEFAREVCNDPEVVRDLRTLTHHASVPYMEYIREVDKYDRPRECKKADLEHNSNIMRLKGVTEKDLERMRKYHASYLYLNGDSGKLLDSFT